MPNHNHAENRAESDRKKVLELIDSELFVDEEPETTAAGVKKAVEKITEITKPPHLTYGEPDSVLTKPLSKNVKLPEGMIGYGGDEKGEFTVIKDDIEVTGFTDNGIDSITLREKKRNEDGIFFDSGSNTMMVTDGVGGSGKGEVGSNVGIYCLSQLLKEDRNVSLDTAAIQMHRAVLEYQENNGKEYKNASAVMAGARVNPGRKIEFMHAGDAKGLLIRNGKIIYETRDENIANLLMAHHKIDDNPNKIDLLESLSEQDPEAILQSLGHGCPFVNFETLEYSDDSINSNHTEKQGEKDDIIVLCSDGLTDTMGSDEIVFYITERLKAGKSLNVISNEIKEMVLGKMKKNLGKPDNLTILIARVK